MSFQGKYQILTALGEGESQSFRARQVSSGRMVILHHLAAGQASSRQPDLPSLVFSFLRNATPEKSRELLDMGEEEGRIWVATVDSPECLDLRRWLLSGLEPPPGGAGNALTAEGRIGPGDPDSRHVFNAEALRKAWSVRDGAPASSAPPQAISPAVESPGADIALPETASAPSQVTEEGAPSVVGFWEKFSEAGPSEHAAPASKPPAGPKNAEAPSAAPEGTAMFFPQRSSLDVPNAPDEVTLTLPAPAARAEPAPRRVDPPVPKQSGPGKRDDLTLAPTEKVEPIGPLGRAEADWPADDSRTQVPRGFEVVFQSSKPQLPSNWGDLPDRPGRAAPQVPIPSPPPLPSPQAIPESERPTRKVPEPPRPPTSPVPPTPVGNSAPARRAVPPVPAPVPPPARRVHPGEYTRMVGSVDALEGDPYPAAPPRQPALYVAQDPPLPTAGRKRKVWVPILILSGLFLSAVAVLVFFAFRR